MHFVIKTPKFASTFHLDKSLVLDVEASNFQTWGGPAALFMVPPKIGHNCRPSNFEEPYLHFQRSDFHKFDIKLFRKERSLKQEERKNC